MSETEAGKLNAANAGANSGNAGDRRTNPRLRGVFDTAYAMIEPFFDPAQGWGGRSLEHLAFRVLRDNFPDLSSEEVHTIIAVAHRVHVEHNPGHAVLGGRR